MGSVDTAARLDSRTEVLAQLTAGIADLTTGDRWRSFLAMQSRFHHYSAGNVVLIAAQCPGATRVAGFAAWKSMGRAVRKGERAIWILAPLVARDEVAADGDSAPAVRGFRRVAVFDLAQTDGAPLPSPCERLKGEVSGEQYPRLVAVAHRIGFLVDDAPLPEGTNGECHFAERRLRIRTGNSEVQRVKTLAHELGHAVLHEFEVDRAKAELEAESIAYVVCRSLGIDSGTYSFGYVATWAGGGDAAITAIRGSCDRIASTAHMILEAAASFSSGRIKGGASG